MGGGRATEPLPAAQRAGARRSTAQASAEASAPTPPPIDEPALFRKRAESFLQSGDHLSAAFCFALAGDNYNAARSYQEAARRLKEQEPGRKEAKG